MIDRTIVAPAAGARGRLLCHLDLRLDAPDILLQLAPRVHERGHLLFYLRKALSLLRLALLDRRLARFRRLLFLLKHLVLLSVPCDARFHLRALRAQFVELRTEECVLERAQFLFQRAAALPSARLALKRTQMRLDLFDERRHFVKIYFTVF